MTNNNKAYAVGSVWAGKAPPLNLCNYCLISFIKNVSEKRNLFLPESGFIEVLLPVLTVTFLKLKL